MIEDLKHYGLNESTINNLSEFFGDDESYLHFMDSFVKRPSNWKEFFEQLDHKLIMYKWKCKEELNKNKK